MIHQGLVVILCDDSDVPDAGVGHIGQGEVDLAVPPAVGQGCDGTFVGQLAQRAVVNIGKDNAHSFHHSVPPFTGLRREQLRCFPEASDFCPER